MDQSRCSVSLGGDLLTQRRYEDDQAYVIVEDVAASWAQYEQFAAALPEATPEGLIVHAAGPTDEGFRIIEVWESQEAWRRLTASVDRVSDDRLFAATRYVRDLRPTRLVLGRGCSSTASHTTKEEE